MDEVRKQIVLHAIRWTSNMIVEIVHAHGEHMPGKVRDLLRDVTTSLSDADKILRKKYPIEKVPKFSVRTDDE